MYKLIAIDLDGTMLNQYGLITQKTKETIKKVQEKGIELIIASGRGISSVKNFAKEIDSRNYFISGNGSIIYDIKNEQILYENILKKSKILDIIKICRENSIYYNVYTEKGIIAESLKYNTLYYYKENLNKEEENQTNINIVPNIEDYVANSNEKFLKVMICDKTKTVFNSIQKRLQEIPNVQILEVSHMSRKIIKQGTEEIPLEYFYTEITAENVDKWNALTFLIKKLNIQKEETMTIGDNSNDINMIKNAGMGIAMGESPIEVKEIAKFVTDNNDEDGVAKALSKLMLQ